MQIYVSESPYNLSVKGRGTSGVVIGDGVHDVVLARLSTGALGWLCEGCKGEGEVPGDRFKPGTRPRCDRCRGTGIRVAYADVASAEFAVRRYLEARTLAPGELAELRAEQHQQWWDENRELVAQVRAVAGQSSFLRRLLRGVDRDQEWSPRQIAIVRQMLATVSDPPPTRFFGEIGEKVEFEGVLTYTGMTGHLHTLPMHSATVTGDGEFAQAVFRMVGHSQALKALRGFDGDRVRIAGIVKEHENSLGTKRTWISRPKLLQHHREVSAEQEMWPGELRCTTASGVQTVHRVRDGRHAFNLLATLFSNLSYGLVVKAELQFDDSEEMLFGPEDIIGGDPQGRYGELLSPVYAYAADDEQG